MNLIANYIYQIIQYIIFKNLKPKFTVHAWKYLTQPINYEAIADSVEQDDDVE